MIPEQCRCGTSSPNKTAHKDWCPYWAVNRDAVIRLINAATRDWVRHILGECDPETCVGNHAPPWKPSEEGR